MKLVFKDVKGNDERMLFIIIVDDDGFEIKKYPIYLTKEMSAKLPVLQDTFTDIKQIFEFVYNSGKKKEELEFVLEDVNIN